MLPAVQRTAGLLSIIKHTESFVRELDVPSQGKLRSLVDLTMNVWKDYIPEEAAEAFDYLVNGEGEAQERIISLAMDPNVRKSLKVIAKRFPSHMTAEEHARAIVELGGLITECPRCEGLIDPYSAALNKEIS